VEISLVKNVSILICLIISLVVAVSLGIVLSMGTLYMIVKIYGNILGYITDLRIYIDLVILEHKRINNLQEMDIIEKKEFFSSDEKKLIEDLQNIKYSKPHQYLKILYN
jgi:hypothetical protein